MELGTFPPYRTLPHYLDISASEAFIDFKAAELRVSLPYPVHKPLGQAQVRDPIPAYQKARRDHRALQKLVAHDLKVAEKDVLDQDWTDSHARIPAGVLELLQIQPPRASVDCHDYNPFYATGSLACFECNEKRYLVRPSSSNVLRVSNLEKPWKKRRIKLSSESVTREPVLGLSSSRSHQEELLLVLRHSNRVNLVSVPNLNDQAVLKWSKKSKKPVLDAKVDPEGTRLGYVEDFGKLKLFDIETKKRVSMGSVDVTEGQKFEFVNGNSVALMGCKSLRLLDLRCGEYTAFQPGLDACNLFCSFKVSNNDVYIASRHYLFRTDLRTFTGPPECCTHLMKSSPCYMDLVNTEDQHLMVLSSQNVGEKVVFNGRNRISSLPFYVPSISETLVKTRLSRDVLLRPDLDERLACSAAGVKLVVDSNSKDAATLYTSNALGEIFAQRIARKTVEESREEENGEEVAVEGLYSFVQSLSRPAPKLHLTTAVNLSHVYEILNRPMLKSYLNRFTKTTQKYTFLGYFREVYAEQNLGDMGSKFAEIWQESLDLEVVGQIPKVRSKEKVFNWIQSISEFAGGSAEDA